MTTKSTKPVTRETSAFFRDKGLRPIVVTIVDSYLELRLKGLRTRETLDIGACYALAVKQRIVRLRAEKAAKRKKR